MLISEFTKEFQNSKQKDKLIQKHIIKKYIPYTTKFNLAKKIVTTCSYKEVNGKRMFILDSPMRYLLYVRCIIEEYTDLDFDLIPETDLFDLSKDIDFLEENHITEDIIKIIGRDADDFSKIINLVLSDEIDNNRSLIPFLETKMQTSSLVFSAIENVLNNENIQEKLINIIKNQ